MSVPAPRILVADDDKVTRHLVRGILTRAGYETAGAKDGVEALRLLRTRRFQLLVLDVWMPRMGGLELLQRLGARKARPRVVVLTADDTPETFVKAVHQRAFSCVQKPVTPAVLIQAFEALNAPDPPRIDDLGAARLDQFVMPHTRSRRTAAGDHDYFDGLDLDVRRRSPTRFASAAQRRGNGAPGSTRRRPMRISPCDRRDAHVSHRRSGRDSTSPSCRYAAIGRPGDRRIVACRSARSKGLRPVGLALTSVRPSSTSLYNEKRNEVVFVNTGPCS